VAGFPDNHWYPACFDIMYAVLQWQVAGIRAALPAIMISRFTDQSVELQEFIASAMVQ
jgi:hypothetical protein